MKFSEKVVIITGASRGIGFALSEEFLKQGAKLALCGSRPETAEQAAKKLRASYPNADILSIAVNVGDSNSVSQMVENVITQWGRIDILINNAGITSKTSLFDLSDEEFHKVLGTNLMGPFYAIREVGKHMKEQGFGSIINTSSVAGIYGGRMQSAYASSKAAVNGLTKSAAKELGPYGIRVNAVAPGVVKTDMVAEFVDERVQAGLQAMTPLGRIAEVRDLVGAYTYLASDDAAFTTGCILSVDGGLVL